MAFLRSWRDAAAGGGRGRLRRPPALPRPPQHSLTLRLWSITEMLQLGIGSHAYVESLGRAGGTGFDGIFLDL